MKEELEGARKLAPSFLREDGKFYASKKETIRNAGKCLDEIKEKSYK